MWCRRPACKPIDGRQDACPTPCSSILPMQMSIKPPATPILVAKVRLRDAPPASSRLLFAWTGQNAERRLATPGPSPLVGRRNKAHGDALRAVGSRTAPNPPPHPSPAPYGAAEPRTRRRARHHRSAAPLRGLGRRRRANRVRRPDPTVRRASSFGFAQDGLYSAAPYGAGATPGLPRGQARSSGRITCAPSV